MKSDLMSYENGVYYRDGDKLIAFVREDNTSLPKGLEYDYSNLEITKSGSNILKISAKVVGWANEPVQHSTSETILVQVKDGKPEIDTHKAYESGVFTAVCDGEYTNEVTWTPDTYSGEVGATLSHNSREVGCVLDPNGAGFTHKFRCEVKAGDAVVLSKIINYGSVGSLTERITLTPKTPLFTAGTESYNFNQTGTYKVTGHITWADGKVETIEKTIVIKEKK